MTDVKMPLTTQHLQSKVKIVLTCEFDIFDNMRWQYLTIYANLWQYLAIYGNLWQYLWKFWRWHWQHNGEWWSWCLIHDTWYWYWYINIYWYKSTTTKFMMFFLLTKARSWRWQVTIRTMGKTRNHLWWDFCFHFLLILGICQSEPKQILQYSQGGKPGRGSDEQHWPWGGAQPCCWGHSQH